MSGKRIFYTASTILALVGVLAGFVFLGNVLAYGKTIYTQLGVFSQVLSYINDNYVDEVDGEKLIDGAISGMLEELDPHCNYLDPDRFKRMQERNRGTYYGIGISFDIVDGDLTVIAPIYGSPSDRLGIRAGDIIAEIEGKSAKGISREEVMDTLRGEKGSTVRVSIKREGVDGLLHFDIVRDEIPIYSVPYHFMIRDDVGYVRMTRFSATTSQELREAIDNLQSQGMEQLVLDLRGNSGGYLNEAIEVADMFLPPNRKIVYTRGRLPDSSEDYYSTGKGKHTEPPLVIMVDGGSASASEIVSGAIQDWDRGLIVGETTFGKGLVQRQYRLKNGAALLLTVARYYTPSGRLIQRDYSDRDKYLHATDRDEA
jgi:carboxyl-terminal processing protease